MGKLITVILTHGFQSDADRHVGVEKLSYTAPNPRLYGERASVDMEGYSIGVQDLARDGHAQDPHFRTFLTPVSDSFASGVFLRSLESLPLFYSSRLLVLKISGLCGCSGHSDCSDVGIPIKRHP